MESYCQAGAVQIAYRQTQATRPVTKASKTSKILNPTFPVINLSDSQKHQGKIENRRPFYPEVNRAF